MDYKTHGVCSSMIHIELDGDKIKDVRLSGIKCGSKATSCPDQLAKALREAIAQ